LGFKRDGERESEIERGDLFLGREGERQGEGLYREGGGGAGNGSKQKFLVLMYTRTTNGCMDTWNYLGFT